MWSRRALRSLVYEDARTYQAPVTIQFDAADPDLAGVVATLDGAPLESGTTVTSYGDHLLAVIATDGSGNITEVRIRFRLLLTPTPVTFALCAEESLAVSNAGTSRGFDRLSGKVGRFGHAGSAGDLVMSNSARIEGDVVVGGDLIMLNAALITGDVFLGGRSSLAPDTLVGGTVVSAPWPGGLCSCGFDLDAAMAVGATTNDNAFLLSDPGIAPWIIGGVLTLSRDETQVTLPAGTFFLTGLSLNNGSTLSAKPGARVTLFVHGPVEVRNAARFNFPPAQAAEVWIISDHQGVIDIENATENGYRFFAPRAHVRVVNQSLLLGTIVGKTLQVANSGTVLRDVAMGDSRRLQPECPIR